MFCNACSNSFTSELREDRTNVAYEQIKSIKENGIVVRLQTYQKTIDAYLKAFENSGVLKNKEYADEIMARRDYVNKLIVSSFKRKFNFSKVYFIPDSSIKLLLKDVRPNIFVNDSLEIDDEITYHGEAPFFMIKKSSDGQGKDPSYIVTDRFMKKLTPPFPSENTLTSGDFIGRMKEGFWYNKSALENDIGQFNSKFHSFYRKALEADE